MQPYDLVIFRLGVKAARNTAMPEVLLEALALRDHLEKPTWVWDQPHRPLIEGHRCWSMQVQVELNAWSRVRYNGVARVSSPLVEDLTDTLSIPKRSTMNRPKVRTLSSSTREEMKTLLRSSFQVQPSENLDFALQNYNLIRGAGLSFDLQEDTAIWKYIVDFVRDHQHVPNITTLRTHFDRIQEHTVSDRLEMLSMEKPKVQGDFRVHLNVLVEDKRLRRMNQILADARSILTTGIQIQEGKKTKVMKGPSGLPFVISWTTHKRLLHP